MVNPLAIWRNRTNNQKGIGKIFADKSLMLDVCAESMEGQRICSQLSKGDDLHKCIGKFCEHFREYRNTDKDNNVTTYHMCVFNKTSDLLIENANLTRSLIQEQRQTQKLLIALYEKEHGEVKA